jgi:cytochrome c peroxidase
MILLVLAGCKKDQAPPAQDLYARPILPNEPYDYNLDVLPDHFHSGALQFFEFIPSSNPVTNEGAALGRVLFYDKQLSENGSISCASCHHQALAFSDGLTFSEGLNGEQTTRNSMALFNKQFERRMFWDMAANTLENQVLQPIENPIEMDLSLEEMRQRIEERDFYPPLFEAAFGDPEVTDERVSRALAQFVRSIVSYRSKYDEGVASDFANFTESELNGKALFYNGETRCNQCHLTSNFYGPSPENNGLDVTYADDGLGNGMFKIPSLRNIALTAPYMHDGRFSTLEEVMHHYNGNVQQHPNLSDQLTEGFETGGTPIQPNLTEQDVADMIAFLHTLTDYEMLTDPKWSDPFVD